VTRGQQSEELHFYERDPEDILLIIVFGLALVLTLAGLVMFLSALFGY
jgi:hypothetical protein